MGLPLENALPVQHDGLRRPDVRGELEIRVVLRDRPRADYEDLRGTESQIIQYRLRGTLEVLAECHRYVFISGKRRGQIAASGRPDPKWLLVASDEWNVAHTDEEGPCPDCAVWRPRALGLR